MIDNQLVTAAYADGLSLEEVGRKFGVSKQRIGQILRSQGTPRRPRGRPVKPQKPRTKRPGRAQIVDGEVRYRCARCGRLYPPAAFYRRPDGRPHSYCIVCAKWTARQWRLANLLRYNTYQRRRAEG